MTIRKRGVTRRTRPEMFIVIGVDIRNHAYNILERADNKETAIEKAGQFALHYESRNGYAGIAVYELTGMAKKPEVPVDFVSVASL